MIWGTYTKNREYYVYGLLDLMLSKRLHKTVYCNASLLRMPVTLSTGLESAVWNSCGNREDPKDSEHYGVQPEQSQYPISRQPQKSKQHGRAIKDKHRPLKQSSQK